MTDTIDTLRAKNERLKTEAADYSEGLTIAHMIGWGEGQAAMHAQLAEVTAERDALRVFVGGAMQGWPDAADMDGFGIQELAEKAGLLAPEPRVAPCNEHCACAEVIGEGEKTICYRITPVLRAAIDAARGEKNGA